MSKTTCGRSQRIGHGEFEVCGLMGPGGVWQCAQCEKLDREKVQARSTRLTVRANGDANSYALLDENGQWFMSMLVNGEQVEARQEANLRRLAACWNDYDTLREALETIAAGNTDPDRMVELAAEALAAATQ